jgi:hypothetical protein
MLADLKYEPKMQFNLFVKMSLSTFFVDISWF